MRTADGRFVSGAAKMCDECGALLAFDVAWTLKNGERYEPTAEGLLTAIEECLSERRNECLIHCGRLEGE